MQARAFVYVPKNELLASLSKPDFARVEPHLTALDLPVHRRLETRQRTVKFVYFIDSGAASVVASGVAKGLIEVGLIGSEGMTGLSVVMYGDRPTHDTFIQMAATGRRMTASSLRREIQASPTLHRALLRYAHSFMSQLSRTAVANARGSVSERLARWLLLAHDRVEGDDLPLTHEFLAIMLNVRRSGVTIALQSLTNAGCVRTRRAAISILNRALLEAKSNGTYP